MGRWYSRAYWSPSKEKRHPNERATQPKVLEPNLSEEGIPTRAGGNSSRADWLRWGLNKIGKYNKGDESHVSHGQKKNLHMTWKDRKLE